MIHFEINVDDPDRALGFYGYLIFIARKPD
jgi:predicted enzyme related to lactoylglutathione lyase